MQLAALKHRTESEDSFVIDATHVRVRFHSAKNDIEKVIVHYCDNYLPLNQAKTIEMTKIGEGQVEDHWGATLEAPFHRLKYTFEVIGSDGTSVVVGQSNQQRCRDSLNGRWLIF